MGPVEEQSTELEVLQSIFEGDKRFKVVANDKFQYKFGDDGHYQSFVLEIDWPTAYPDVPPVVNLDLFYNKHLLPQVKERIISALAEEAKVYLGMAVTFTLIELVKERFQDLLKDQTEAAVVEANAPNPNGASESDSDTVGGAIAGGGKKTQMTKAQKRRMWARQDAGKPMELERGYGWVDIVKHLSQTRDT